MVYDCFPFFNELDLLEIRLNELDAVVDKFVLVEATRTFQKEPKPLYYEENKERFKKFEHKIIHVVVDEYPGFFAKFRIPTAWDYDNHQKNQVKKALKDCKPDDDIIISDLDEIPSAAKVTEHLNIDNPKVFEQRLSNFYVNCVATDCIPDNTHSSRHYTFLIIEINYILLNRNQLFVLANEVCFPEGYIAIFNQTGSSYCYRIKKILVYLCRFPCSCLICSFL